MLCRVSLAGLANTKALEHEDSVTSTETTHLQTSCPKAPDLTSSQG